MSRLGLLSLLLAACVSFEPSLGHRTVSVDVERRLGVPTGWNQGRPEDDEVASRLDALLTRPLDVHSAVAVALINNGHLQATYEELGIAQADLVQAGLLKNPILSGSIGLPVGPAHIFEAEGALVQNFLDIFMLPLRKRLGRTQFDAAVIRVTNETLEEAAKVSALFASYVCAEQQRRVAVTAVEGFAATALLANRQREAGNITAYQLTTEQAALEQVMMTLTQAEIEVAQAREQLNQHLGLWGARTKWVAIDALPAPSDDLPAIDSLEREAVSQRLDLELARLEVDLSTQALELARTFRWVGAFELGVHAHQDPDGARLLGPSLQLELPLFDQRQALLARLEAEQARAEHRLRAHSVDVRSEVRLAFTRVEAASRLVATAETRLLPLRAQAVKEAQLLYNGMLIGLYELMATRQAQLEAQRNALIARRDYWVARAELVRALGGRWPSATPRGTHD